MKTRLVPIALLVALSVTAGVPVPAQTAPVAADAPRELSVVVVESLGRGSEKMDIFNRIDRVFTDVIRRKKWPVKVTAERFAANTPAHETELRIFFKDIREESPGDLTFHAWVTLDDHGAKHDFGIIRFRYYPRPMEQRGDVLDEVVRGAALAIADKIEPILFPKADGPKT